MSFFRVGLFSLLALLSACEPKFEKAAEPVVNAPPAPPPLTKADWQKGFKNSFVESQLKVSDDGMSEFVGCFFNVLEKCGTFTFGSRDAVRGITFFQPASSRRNEFYGTYVPTYISLPDCEKPTLLMKVLHQSKNGWLFVNRVSVLADNNLLLDHEFSAGEVDRQNFSYGITEVVNWITSDAEIHALRKVPGAQTLIIRITGSKGYVTIEKSRVADFRKDIEEVLAVYDKLQTELSDKIPATCT